MNLVLNEEKKIKMNIEDRPTIKALCFCYFDNIVLIYLDMIKAISNWIEVKPTFLLGFQDEIIEKMLSEQGYRFYRFDWKTISENFRKIPIPFLRIFLMELSFYKIYKKILKQMKTFDFDILFFNDNTNSVGKYFLRLAKKKKIKSFFYVFGLGARSSYRFKHGNRKSRSLVIQSVLDIEKKLHIKVLQWMGILPNEPISTFNLGWDFLLVRTNDDKNLMLQHGIPEKRIRVVGSIWDYKLNCFIKEIERKKTFTNQSKKMILITLQPVYKLELSEKGDKEKISFFKNLDILLNSLVKNSGERYHIVAKFHPRDDLDLYKDILKKYQGKVRWVRHKEEDTLRLILQSDLVITQCSTTILDAISAHRKVLFYKFSDLKNPFVDYPKLFKNFYVYDPNKSIDENIKLAEKMEINIEEYCRRLEKINFEKEFARFILDCVCNKK